MTPVDLTAADEVIMPGGKTNRGLISRVGDTVRRPSRPTGPATRALLDHLAEVGFDGAPRYLGSDRRGREVLTFIPGQAPIAPTPEWAQTDAALISVAELLRSYHDAAASFDPTPYQWPHPLPARFRGTLVTHNDPNLDNIIFRDGRAVGLIDFDLASPGCAAWDLACAARLWAPLRATEDAPAWQRDRALERLGLFADAYGATPEDRAGMVEAIVDCHRWCYAIVEQAATRGHTTFGPEWSRGGERRADRTRRWLADHRPQLRAALGLN